MVKPVEKPVEIEPEQKHSQPEVASSNPPGYASIAAGKDNGLGKALLVARRSQGHLLEPLLVFTFRGYSQNYLYHSFFLKVP